MKERDLSIDILRGLAIFSMIPANMAPYNYLEPHPIGFRLFGSIAAPLFVFLAGMMVSYTMQIKQHALAYYLKRCLATLLVASFIDLFIWDILPFVTYDVLYIIALAMPVIYFTNKLQKALQLALILFIFGLSALLQYLVGYAESPAEVSISDGEIMLQLEQISVWRQFLIDGWFPVFPWLGVSLIGAFVGRLKFNLSAADFRAFLLRTGIVLFLLGLIYWIIFQPVTNSNAGFLTNSSPDNFWQILITREGYSELFYPPTLFYFCLFIGFIFILITLIERVQNNKLIQVFTVLGRSSLLVYILHTLFIATIFSNESIAIGAHPFIIFSFLFLLHTVVVWTICFAVQKLKKGKQLPFLVNFILGS